MKPLLPAQVLQFYAELRRERPLVDRSQVVLFAGPESFPGYTLRQDPSLSPRKRSVRVSLIATVYNEAANAAEWLESIRMQTRLPDEIVISDGGSTDGTMAILRKTAQEFPISVRVIEAPGANISQGRNIAIRAAAGPVLACTDFGCLLHPQWLERLVAPFEIDPEVQLSAGYYGVLGDDEPAVGLLVRLNRSFFGVDLGLVTPSGFLPSSRSLAMTKALWEQAGGYPEWLTDAGEDTLFDYQLKSQPARWAFVPDARVYWRAPGSFQKLFKTYYRYARGDGETGINAPLYWYKIVEFGTLWTGRFMGLLALAAAFWLLRRWALLPLLAAALWLLYTAARFLRSNRKISSQLGTRFFPYTLILEIVGALQAAGYARGVFQRPELELRRADQATGQIRQILDRHPHRAGIIVYPPTHDWGFMFQRPHQMARAFARQGYLYFYCTLNERTDAVYGFREVEPNLYVSHVPLESFRCLERPIVYLGSAWLRPTLEAFDRPTVIYDHYDDLEVSGARPEDHLALLQRADVVLVTSQLLQERVTPTRPDALLAPNGVDWERIQESCPQPGDGAPADWEQIAASGRPAIGYSGALAEWFDFELLASIACARPQYQFVLIGVDYDSSLPRSGVLELENVHWLGMKPIDRLFEYVWRFDVGTIPFKVNAITLATSPIKMFEYMACRKPVVATPLPECQRYPEIRIAETSASFAAHLDAALHSGKEERDALEAVARANTWDSRARAMIEALLKKEVF